MRALGPEVLQLSEGTNDTKPLEDVPDSYHTQTPVKIGANNVIRGVATQYLLTPNITYMVMTKANQPEALRQPDPETGITNLTTPENLCVHGKQYTVRDLSLRYTMSFKNMELARPGVFRFRIVTGYVENNAFTGTNFASYRAHAEAVTNKFFDASKKFGGLGVTGEMKIISDRIHQVVPSSTQSQTSVQTTGVTTYPSINGYVRFPACRGKKSVRPNTGSPAGDGNLCLDNSKSNGQTKIPFILFQNLDGMQDVSSDGSTKVFPELSYFWAKQYTDY